MTWSGINERLIRKCERFPGVLGGLPRGKESLRATARAPRSAGSEVRSQELRARVKRRNERPCRDCLSLQIFGEARASALPRIPQCQLEG